MYLEGEKFLWSYPDMRPREDGFPVASKTLRLGYWRKHPNLHGYIVNTFADGEDHCQRIELGEDAILQITNAVQADVLPHTVGFFFGETDGSEREETLTILTAALEWLRMKEEGVFRSVYYQASW